MKIRPSFLPLIALFVSVVGLAPATATAAFEAMAQVSPNGKYVAYQSDESTRFDIFVTTFPDPGTRWQVSQAGGVEPRWSKDGKLNSGYACAHYIA